MIPQKAPKRVNQEMIESASITAMMRAIMASSELNKVNPDYLAENFIAGDWKNFLQSPLESFKVLEKRIPGAINYIQIRTKYFDRSLERWLKKYNNSQVVIIGAGFDSRAIRFRDLSGNGTVFYELDLEAMLEYKDDILTQIKHPRNSKTNIYVPINLHTDDISKSLIDNGFDKDKNTIFLLEGISFFIEPRQIKKLLFSLKTLVNRNISITLDYAFQDYIEGNIKYLGAKETKDELKKLGEPHLFGLNFEDVYGFADDFNFVPVDNFTSKMLETKFLSDKYGNNLFGYASSFFGLVEFQYIIKSNI